MGILVPSLLWVMQDLYLQPDQALGPRVQGFITQITEVWKNCFCGATDRKHENLQYHGAACRLYK